MSKLKLILNKVPEITLYFWVIKVLCTTVGETAADFLNVNLNFGLVTTSLVIGILLAVALFFQFKASKYIPTVYWITVALVSVFGTLVTDNLTDKLGFPLESSTILFATLLGLTFLFWYLSEKTLSIHSIFTRRREVFYWCAILFTFALGTAAGDLFAEGLRLGYLNTGLIVLAIIIVTSVAWKMRMNPILSFWVIYIMTRPLGASIGDFLSQSTNNGGIGLGSTITSIIFLGSILIIVTYLSLTKKDVIPRVGNEYGDGYKETGAVWQTIVAVVLFIIVGGTGYKVLHSKLQTEISGGVNTTTSIHSSKLGDLSTFRIITTDTLDKLNKGDQTGATTRISELEYTWDKAQPVLKARDSSEWAIVDGKIDVVLRELRAMKPNLATEKSALQLLLDVLH